MITPTEDSSTATAEPRNPKQTARWIAAGLLLGILCGILFGEYCGFLQVLGQAYVGLLQMTVLPYLVVSLIAKLGRLDVHQAQRLGVAALVVLLILWSIGILLIVLVTGVLPPVQGASFFSPPQDQVVGGQQDFLSQLIPTNVFRALSDEFVPGVVLFCLLFGAALILVPGKEPLLDFLDICAAGIGRINLLLVRLAPIGLFALTAAAAGTLRVEELTRLQAYLIMFTLACVLAAFGILPLLVSSLTPIRYRDLLRAAQEPLYTAIATGKLFVVLPQIVEKCEQLLSGDSETGKSVANVVVPMAYPFPHLGKILAFVFVSFAAWYVGRGLSPGETAVMAATGAVSSFASPLVTVPYLLDQYRLPQDLMPLFILPGFITTRLADVVGVLHLMALTLIVNQVLERRIRVRWGRLATAACAMLICLVLAGAASRWYLASTTLDYDLDDRLLSLELPSAHDDVLVFNAGDDIPSPASLEGSTLDRIKTEKLLRVGYYADRLPYTYLNRQRRLVGLDVELMHRLAQQLDIRLEFVPYTYDTVLEQLAAGEVDLVAGGVMISPRHLLRAGFTQPYQTATMSVVMRDHRRGELNTWDDPDMPTDLRLAVVFDDLAVAARRRLPNVEIVVITSFSSFFSEQNNLDGLIIAGEVGAAWNILYPEYTVVVPQPVIQLPVGMAVRSTDTDWLRFLDRWLDLERMNGSLDRLRTYWIEGGATEQRPPRWCVMRDVLHWIP